MKLGLIALSGIRAYDPELTALGLTLPGFVERSRVIASLPSLGLLTLAGMTPAHIDVTYIDLPEALGTALPGDFDAVAISSFTARIRDAYILADAYRKAGTRVILGGLHVSAKADEALRHADAVVLGEGEPLWPNVLDDLEHGRLQTIYDARSHPFDLAEAPIPRFDLLDVQRYNRLTVQTQRGCPFDCEFCAASPRLVSGYKVKPAQHVEAEISRIKEFWPRPFIELADDNTFVNKTRGRELLHVLANQKVRWFTETDISVADDPELLGLMRDSGCAQVLVGLEGVSGTALDGIERRNNWKMRQVDHYLDSIGRIQDHGITVNGCFILGLDHTGTDSFTQVAQFVQESGLYEVQITVQTPFPGTPLYKRLEREQRLIRADAWELCTLFDVNFLPTDMTVAELEGGLRDLARQLYSEECTHARRERYRQRLRAAVKHDENERNRR
ncbi:MAG: radical SAM protein [Caldilineaceae bacterium]